MSQEIYLQDESSEDFNDTEAGNDDDNNNDGLLFESTVGSDITDFGSRHQHQEDITEAVYNPYDMIIPRAKSEWVLLQHPKIAESAVLQSNKHSTTSFAKKRKTWHPKNHLQKVELFLFARLGKCRKLKPLDGAKVRFVS